MKLSLILCSRNDNYCGDSVGRLNEVLHHTACQLSSRPAEVIVSDWSSDEPLENVLEISDEARKITRFSYIPKWVTRKFETEFSEVHALNSAARLARGAFIARIDQDTLIGDRFVEWFFSDQPREECFYWSPRRDLGPNDTLESSKDPATDDRGFWREMGVWRSSVGIFLVPKKHYFDLGGYDETNIHSNHMEQEFLFRLSRVARFVDLGKILDYDFYHIWHDRADNEKRCQNRMVPMAELLSLPLRPNGENWGLRDIRGN